MPGKTRIRFSLSMRGFGQYETKNAQRFSKKKNRFAIRYLQSVAKLIHFTARSIAKINIYSIIVCSYLCYVTMNMELK